MTSRHRRSVSASALSRTTATGACIDAIDVDQRRDAGHAGTRRRQRPEHLRLDPLDAIEDHGEIGQEHGRVVVAGVDRQPHHPRLLALGPLRQQGRLAVARRRDDGDHRGLVCGDETIDEGRAGDDALADRGGSSLDSSNSNDSRGRVRRSCRDTGVGRGRRPSRHPRDANRARRHGFHSSGEQPVNRRVHPRTSSSVDDEPRAWRADDRGLSHSNSRSGVGHERTQRRADRRCLRLRRDRPSRTSTPWSARGIEASTTTSARPF